MLSYRSILLALAVLALLTGIAFAGLVMNTSSSSQAERVNQTCQGKGGVRSTDLRYALVVCDDGRAYRLHR
jgi:hypothetical protein